jgi:hypothetical protein
MTEGREATAVLDYRLDERLVEPALEAGAAGHPAECVRNAVEMAIEIAESLPDAAYEALSALRSDPAALQRLEGRLRMGPEQATLALGAAIQIGLAELASPTPNLRNRLDELLCWLEGSW